MLPQSKTEVTNQDKSNVTLIPSIQSGKLKE